MSNRARCEACKVVIESRSRHDFSQCPGGHIFVDGGDDYSRCGYDIPHNFTRLLDDGTEESMVDSIRTYRENHPDLTLEKEEKQDLVLPGTKTDRILQEILETLKRIERKVE